MAKNQWNELLLEQVRQLPMASSKEQVQLRLNLLIVEASKQKKTIPTEFELIFQAYQLSRSGKLIDSISVFFDAINFSQQNQQEFLICFCHYNIGTLYGMLGNYFYAQKFLTKAEKMQQFCDGYITGIIKNNIGDIFRQIGNFNEALIYLTQAAEQLSQHGPKTATALSYFNIAEIKAKQFLFAEANELLEKLYQDIKNEPRYLGFYYKIKAEIASHSGEFEQADKLHLLSIENMQISEHDYYYAEMILEYCHFLTSCLQYKKLDQFIALGLAVAKKIESDKLIDGFNDIILLRIKDIDDINIREKHYQTLTSSLLNSRRELLKREGDYLQQLYRLNVAKLNLSTMKSLSDNLAVINKVGHYINTSSDIKNALPQIQQDLASLFQTDTLALGFYNSEQDQITIHYLDNNLPAQTPYITDCKSEATYMSYCIKSNSAFYFNHMNSEQKVAMLGDRCDSKVQFKSAMFSPITINGEVKGVFTIQARESYQYQTFHFELFSQLISYISIALENQYNRQQLLHLSQTDHLTQVWNRKSLEAHFNQLKQQQNQEYTGIMIDIDHYKEYNDTYGHIAGDEVLIQVSRLIKQGFHSLETQVYRYGGDEFFVLIPSIKPEKIRQKLDKLLIEVKKLLIPHKASTCSCYLSISVGIGYNKDPENQLSLNSLVNTADRALYQAKENGRNCYFELAHIKETIY
ncbi:sensor domain-containing diguanylate cyclase [Aliivibrio fischeri]|uniref:diguanylate cyclase n=1 Tax=Aliivibrio fischeri SR5 TaxID=1088719 RepID=A0AAV3ESG5_ALIFS|nr:GGDEF domain-containing protein [Aliivibrio fischeri]EHN69609.1 GGDEF domain-containing protein [Aliivibrio fischeri SR5]